MAGDRFPANAQKELDRLNAELEAGIPAPDLAKIAQEQAFQEIEFAALKAKATQELEAKIGTTLQEANPDAILAAIESLR